MEHNKDFIKTVHSSLETVVDNDTGEILNVVENKTQIITNADKFALIYAKFWDSVTESTLSMSDLELFGFLVNNYGKNVHFSISYTTKLMVSKKSGKAITSYNKSTKALLNAGFIYNFGGKRIYKINPRYAFEGSSSNRKKAIITMQNYRKEC